MATKIVTKNSSTASAVPTASDLVQGELAVNVADKRLFTEDNAGAIVELGTNPSTIDINAGTIDGTTIGASSASTGAFTTLTATGAFTSRGIDDNADATAITIDSSENVGIGTGSPAKTLEVNAGTNTEMRIGTTTNGSLQLGHFSNGAFIGTDSGTPAAADLVRFGTGGSERLRIDASGNVGIGTTASNKLDIKGTVGFEATNSTNKWLAYHYTDNTLRFNYNGAGADELVIDSSGRVGIGTSSTDTGSMLTVAGAATFTGQNTAHGASRLKIGQDTTAISQIRFYGANTSTAGILQFIGSSSDGTVGGERMRIDASGNVLVGTTNTANLATHTPNVVTDLQYGINDGSNIASFGLDRIHFNSSNYYVLNASSTGVRLINGATSWTTQSDENSKENIVELSNALTAVNAMRCVRYNLKSQTSDDVKIGFIAQDWQSSYPEVVATDTDGILGMNYTETIPVLLKAIQEQQTLIESLTTRIAALEE